MRLWHGGKRGLKVGDLILPPQATKTKHSLAKYIDPDDENQEAAQVLLRGDRVFMSTDISAARAFAAFYPGGGSLYRVEPIGEIQPDPDAPGLAFSAPRALILAVDQAWVPFNPESSLRTLLSMEPK